MQEQRGDERTPRFGTYSMAWTGTDGLTYNTEARGLNISKSGIAIECHRDLPGGQIVFLQSQDGSFEGDCEVVHSTRRAGKYIIGLEFRVADLFEEQAYGRLRSPMPNDTEPDYYEILQISPKADVQTIHRVFRMMAARFHPDNPETGDVEEFLRLKKAYSILSDAALRTEYDAVRAAKESGPLPVFELKDFVTDADAEINRRLGLLSILYNQRRMDPEHPGVSMLDLEARMGFPREHLMFTLWYLRAKAYVIAEDNSDYALTAEGADFVERKATRSEILGRLLRPGSSRVPVSRRKKPESEKKPRFLLGSSTTPASD